MAQPDGAQSGADPNAQSGGTGPGDTTGATGASGTPEAGATGTPPVDAASGQTFTAAEYEALKARMIAADQRASAKEAELKQLVDKDLPELDKLRRDLQDAQKAAETSTAALSALRIENAFLTDNTHQWQNPATALKLLDRSKVTVDADGKVEGMKNALEALAKSDAYLLKPKTGEEGDGAAGGGNQQHLGTPPANGGTQGTGGKPTDLTKRFPAMRGRA